MRIMFTRAIALVGAVTLILPTLASAASIDTKRAEAENQLPVCARSLGTIAVYEPEMTDPSAAVWTKLGLESPEALLKIFVMRSHCFTLVDRGKGFSAVERERALASGGQLQQGSNVGGGQIKSADYVLVPDIASKNENSGGSAIFGILGALVPGAGGALLGGIRITDKEADVTLALTDVRTSEQVAAGEGHGKKSDLSFGGGGAVVAGGGFGGLGAGAYENTEIGQVVTLAYIAAYRQVLTQMNATLVTPDQPTASEAAPAQAVTMARAGHLFSEASLTSSVLRDLPQGAMLYPTGTKDGVWWEVTDELGTKGWVSSALITLAK